MNDPTPPVPPDPWYTRSEFWTMIASTLLGIFGTKIAPSPIVQNVSATLTGLSPLVYMWGRGNVKAAQASTAMTAVGKAVGAFVSQ